MTPLLTPVMLDGHRVTEPVDHHGAADDVPTARRRCGEDLDRLPDTARRLHAPRAPIPRYSPMLRCLAYGIATEFLDRHRPETGRPPDA